ncbi:MAG: Gfo/Idh/MocA family oxidoreductase [Chloroflexota bacterium]
MSTGPLKAAMIGLRIHAGTLDPDKNHGLLKSFNAHPDVDVMAYCEWDTTEAAALDAIGRMHPTARIYTDLDELLTNEVFELAVIMLPPNEAIRAALRLVEAGKHLYIEKQAAQTAAQLEPLRAIAQQNEVVIQVGYPWPCHPVAKAIKQHIEAGDLGRLAAMEARLVTTGIGPGLRDPKHWMYRKDGEGGGMLHMEGGHWLTLFRFFANARVKSVTALCSRVIGNIEEGLEDVVTVALEFDSGVHASLHMGYLLPAVGPRNDMFFALRGTQGTATWPEPGSGAYTVASGTPNWASAPVRSYNLDLAPRPVYADQWGYEFVADFVRAIRKQREPLVSLDDAVHVLQIIDAAYESSQSGRRITLG